VSDLVKNLMGGGWSLIVGWVLPTFISMQLITILILPDVPQLIAARHFLQRSYASQQLTLLAVSLVVGIVLSAAQAPLYRVLEGYAMWPAWLANARIKRHKARRRSLVQEYTALSKTDMGVRAGLIYERAARYPTAERQFAPTALGNAIRRFETYAGDRYKLDSQLLWRHLTAVAPPQALSAVDNSRTSVDFFVTLIYGGYTTTLLAICAGIIGHGDLRPVFAAVLGIAVAVSCYRLAVLATDEWNAAVRAVVDHGRFGLAAAFDLAIPKNLSDERYMWQAVNTLVRREYSYSESKDVPAILQRFRAPDSALAISAMRVAARRGAVPGRTSSLSPAKREK
jgi:hypothetical protein